MAVRTQIGIEEYLHTSFEHDREYVHGEIIERGMPTYSHGRVQASLCIIFRAFEKTHGLFATPELRVRLACDVVRIPDLSVYIGQPPEVPDTPPFVVIEITSPDDRTEQTIRKLDEYRNCGVPHVWLIDPKDHWFFIYRGSLERCEALELPEFGIRITLADLFD